ncbi:MAG: hypothetical protein O3C63_01300 [Cyanobacteria bacterium]|nr:hypothetical protein [Cyanobacteriota bacterium]MDA1020728.1 hypothetical protein [Cyanobacteriota bacterium]
MASAALKNLVPVDIIDSTNLGLDLQIVEDDKSLDLSIQPELQFQVRPNSLHVSDSKSAAFKMDVFVIQADGSREFIASQNTTISKNKSKNLKRFTLTLDSSSLENGINN